MAIFIKILIALSLLAWIALGIWMVIRSVLLFGPDRENPSESPGARSLGGVHIISIWVGFFALGVYFLFL